MKEYRELQRELKELGLSAYGKRHELEQRLADAKMNQAIAERPTGVGEVAHFVFVGDSGKRTRLKFVDNPKTGLREYSNEQETITVDANNPPKIRWSLGGDMPRSEQAFYDFDLNGAPVAVDDPDSIRKLREHQHFNEVTVQ